jgi:signal transduction histidine kinase
MPTPVDAHALGAPVAQNNDFPFDLREVDLAPGLSVYQLSEFVQALFLGDGRLFEDLLDSRDEIVIPPQFAPQSLRMYNAMEADLETWFAEKWLPSILMFIELITVAHYTPFDLTAKFSEVLRDGEHMTEVTRQKFLGLYALQLANEERRRGPVAAIDILHSLSALSDEATLHYKTLRALNERLKHMEATCLPPDLAMRWSEAMIAGAGLMHDIDNLNTGLTGYCALGLDIAGTGDPADVRRAVKTALEGLKNFDYSSVEGAMQLAEAMYRKRAFKHGVRVDIQKNGEVRVPKRIRFNLFRAVSELLLNGIKYRDDGKVSIEDKERAGGDPSNVRYVEGSYHIDGAWLTVRVKDNGVGIENIERVMQPGVRLRRDLETGSGWGLAAVKLFAKQNGGDLRLSSKVGVGTEAELRIYISEWQHRTGPAGSFGRGFGGGGVGHGSGGPLGMWPSVGGNVVFGAIAARGVPLGGTLASMPWAAPSMSGGAFQMPIGLCASMSLHA